MAIAVVRQRYLEDDDEGDEEEEEQPEVRNDDDEAACHRLHGRARAEGMAAAGRVGGDGYGECVRSSAAP